MHSSYICDTLGAKRAVLMIHGICSTPRHFDWLIPEFDDSWAVYNILLDGHGSTVEAFAETSMKKWKAQTREVLKHISSKYDHILVIGYSMGTLLLMDALSDYPKIKGMILMNVPLYPWVKPTMLGRSIRFTKGIVRNDNPHEAACIQDLSITLKPGIMRYAKWLPRFWELLVLCRKCRRYAMNISIPCKVYFGGKDELVSLRSAKYFKDIPNVELRVFRNAGHFYIPDQDKQTIILDLQKTMELID